MGAIDLVDQGKTPILVSQRASGDSDRQRAFAAKIGPSLTHLQLSDAARPPGTAERSQRARSIIFLAYGLLAASALRASGATPPVLAHRARKRVYQHERSADRSQDWNLSTRTTHPFLFLRQIQAIWAAVGLSVEIRNPYQFRTKGELLAECRRQGPASESRESVNELRQVRPLRLQALRPVYPVSGSARRLLRLGCSPDATEYVYEDLKSQSDFDDVRSAALACIRAETEGVRRWSRNALRSRYVDDVDAAVELVERGTAGDPSSASVRRGRVIDFHCHVDLFPDPAELVAEITRRKCYVLAVTTTPLAWAGTNRVVGDAPRVKVGLGLHPELVAQRHAEVDEFGRLLPQARYVGEIGLDGSARHRSSFGLQQRVFRKMLRLTEEAGGRIMSIHSRGAATSVLDEIERHPAAGTAVLHWFTGTNGELRRASDLGCWFSVGPAMLRTKKGRRLVEGMPPGPRFDRVGWSVCSRPGGPGGPLAARRVRSACSGRCGPWVRRMSRVKYSAT